MLQWAMSLSLPFAPLSEIEISNFHSILFIMSCHPLSYLSVNERYCESVGQHILLPHRFIVTLLELVLV